MRNICLVIVVFCLFMLSGCGSKRNPTGGAEDTEKPSILSTNPAEFGDISSKVIEVDFSKNMDKSTLTNSVYFYPPITNRRIYLSRSTLKIEIREDLQDNSFYYITLSTRIKDLRGNELERPYTLIFKHGNPATASISGLINYEDQADNGAKVKLSVFSADSLLVMMDELQGSSYELLNLTPAEYQLRTYIDKNLNNRYDTTLEPFFEKLCKADNRSTMDISLAYADTSMAQIRQIRHISPQELEVELSEPISNVEYVELLQRDSENSLSILKRHLEGNILRMLIAKPDSSSYDLNMRNLTDLKGNISPMSGLQFNPRVFSDTSAVSLVSILPRNGATVNSLQPTIELVFSEIVTSDNLHVSLIASESKQEIPLAVEANLGRKIILKPRDELVNYRSYKLVLHKETSDYYGNTMAADIESVFLPIKR
ncbi:MAG: Ig-like domain-containing protein [Candidatus Cloacimonetes bacterium]|nr:Ig-like domain-containing protein [Candidatus Cloacimonadota bacterium]MCB5278261.1 Ig-like domain-containing protein [Candidatus Cloacimonadota bacterium]